MVWMCQYQALGLSGRRTLKTNLSVKRELQISEDTGLKSAVWIYIVSFKNELIVLKKSKNKCRNIIYIKGKICYFFNFYYDSLTKAYIWPIFIHYEKVDIANISSSYFLSCFVKSTTKA